MLYMPLRLILLYMRRLYGIKTEITIPDFVKRSYKAYFCMKYGDHLKFGLNRLFAKPMLTFFVFEQIVNLNLNLY